MRNKRGPYLKTNNAGLAAQILLAVTVVESAMRDAVQENFGTIF